MKTDRKFSFFLAFSKLTVLRSESADRSIDSQVGNKRFRPVVKGTGKVTEKD